MAVRAKKLKVKQQLTDEGEAWLHGDDKGAGFVKYGTDDELAALWAAQGQAGRARAVLQPIFDTFMEGSDTADLRAAQQQLVMLR